MFGRHVNLIYLLVYSNTKKLVLQAIMWMLKDLIIIETI